MQPRLNVTDPDNTGRGSRIRKAKIVFDPSDGPIAKRQSIQKSRESNKKESLSNRISIESATVSSSSLASTPTPSTPTPAEPDELVAEIIELEPPAQVVAKPIDKRRKTTNEIDNGCIVCGRTDVKKGRFVYCSDCCARGHFTCLRNFKLISSPCEEATWQCSTCQTCGICYESSVLERLCRCITCSNSYHLTCQKEQTTKIKRKQFKCENCRELENFQNASYKEESTNGSTKASQKKRTNGFAGFSREDTTTKNGIAQPTPTVVNGIDDDKHDNFTDEEDIQKANHDPKYKMFENSSDDTSEADDLKTMSNGDIKHDVFFSRLSPSLISKKNDMIKTTETIPDVRNWDSDEIFTYFMGTTTAEYAHIFKDHEIDGDALLLVSREDVLTKFNLKLGPALRLYSHILTLQFKNNNPIFGWDED